jgi:hypothetical protein
MSGARRRGRFAIVHPVRATMIGCLTLAAATGARAAWDVGDTGQMGQWTIYGRSAFGAAIGLPLASGDLNGDGFADVILTPMNADSGPSATRDRAGEGVIVLSSGTISGQIDLAALNPAALPSTATLIYGADALDFLGTEVWVEDIDGDGTDDALLGAQYGDGPADGRANCGDVVIVWGGSTIGGRVIDLDAPQVGEPVTLLYGPEAGDRFGVWVGAADFDGDGTNDALIGADQGDGPSNARTHAGETHVVYGGSALRAAATVDLASTMLARTVVYGIGNEDHSGCTVRGHDLNGDGAAELLIGAGLNRASASIAPDGQATGHGVAGGDGPRNNRSNAGEAYVVYGQVGSRPASIDLQSPPASTVIIYGADAGDAYGEELYGGDFDGDGHGDVLVGALTADGIGDAEPNAGEAALIRGSMSLPGSVIDLASPPASVTIFYGAAEHEIAGDTAFMVDMDGDGRDDLAIGSPFGAPGGRVHAGRVDVLFGTGATLPASVDLASPPSELAPLAIEGGSDDDILAYSADFGDVDGDGTADLAINAMGGDGATDDLTNTGDAYVLSGAQVSAAAGRLGGAPTATRTSTPTRTPAATPSGTATGTPTATATLTASPTETPTDTPSFTPTFTPTASPSLTASSPPTGTPSATPSLTATASRTPSHTPSVTPTASATATPTRTSRQTPTASATATPSGTATGTPTATATLTFAPVCAADCDDNRIVTADELVLAVSIAFGNGRLADCRNADGDGDGLVFVNEIVRGVRTARDGCG